MLQYIDGCKEVVSQVARSSALFLKDCASEACLRCLGKGSLRKTAMREPSKSFSNIYVFRGSEQGLQKRFCILCIIFRHTAVLQDMDF
jgi:hypothetical protein